MPLRIAGRTLGGLVVLAVIVLAAGWFAIHRADQTLERLLHDFAVHTVAEQSNGIYRLVVGRIRFNWALRHVTLDSASLTTDSAANALLPHPAPTVEVGLYGCAITGVGLRKLVLNDGLFATRFGCGVVTVQVAVNEIAAPSARAPADTQASNPAFLVMQRGLKLPSFSPRLHISRIDFPHASFVYSQPLARGGRNRVALEHLEWHLRDLTIDPADPLAARRPLFSKSVDLSAANLAFHPDTVSVVAIRRLRMHLVDSTLDLDTLEYGPTVSDRAFEQQTPWRRTRVRLSATALRATGVDFGRLLRRGGAFVRRVDLDSAVGDIWMDKRRPPNPHPRSHLTPQAWFRGSPGSLRIDTVAIQGRLSYREVREAHEHAGLLTFTRLQALATNVAHFAGRVTTGDSMTLTTSALLQNTGRLTATFVVPLDAPGFDMRYRGSLGPMPAESLNRFIQNTMPARIAGGHVEGIDFRVTVTNGHARGTLEPRYAGFSLQVTREGTHGMLARGGTLGHMIRSVASAVVNSNKIRPDNPAKEGAPPIVATVDHVYVTPPEQLFSFVWLALRDALLGVVKK